MKWLERGMWDGPHLVLCLDKKALKAAFDHVGLKRRFRSQFPKSGLSTKYMASANGGSGVCIVCVSRIEKNEPVIPIYAAICHEAVHVWQWHCKETGERRPGNEAEAYAIQSISQELMLDFERQMKKRKGKGK